MESNYKNNTCTKCGLSKSLDNFPLCTQRKDGRYSWCKTCCSIISKKRRKKYPWEGTYNSIKQRCNNIKCKQYKDYGGRGIKCLITLEELKALWYKDKACEMSIPTIDRKNNDGNYELSNCGFIEKSKNSAKDKEKQVNQYNLERKFIKTWKSLMEVERKMNFYHGNISKVISGKRKSAYGFIWGFNRGGNLT